MDQSKRETSDKHCNHRRTIGKKRQDASQQIELKEGLLHERPRKVARESGGNSPVEHTVGGRRPTVDRRRRRVPGLVALAGAARGEFCELYLDLLRRFDRLFDRPAPYISAWHQAPVRRGSDDFALHLELFTVRRAPGKLKYLAGSESGMGAFITDTNPEDVAEQLRAVVVG